MHFFCVQKYYSIVLKMMELCFRKVLCCIHQFIAGSHCCFTFCTQRFFKDKMCTDLDDYLMNILWHVAASFRGTYSVDLRYESVRSHFCIFSILIKYSGVFWKHDAVTSEICLISAELLSKSLFWLLRYCTSVRGCSTPRRAEVLCFHFASLLPLIKGSQRAIK